MSQYELSVPDCVSDEFDGEVVVLHMTTGVYHCLRGLAAVLWRDLVAGHPLAKLASLLGAVDAPLAEAGAGLIDRIVAIGLLRPAVLAVPVQEPALVAALAAGERELDLESHDDMRDLVLSDPIHDVDEEVGWPMLKV